MAKLVTRYVCQSCGAWHGKWSGQCAACGEWNQLVEEVVEKKKTTITASSSIVQFSPLLGETKPVERIATHIQELDRVCGGGFVPGSVLLVGGDPGIGKSTLLMQTVSELSRHGVKSLYLSGEEAQSQIQLRAHRLGVHHAHALLATETSVDRILDTLEKNANAFQVVIVDSIQTMQSDSIDSPPGTVSQVRYCAHKLIEFAKKNQVTVVLVGHVTKEGTLAGPRVLEHMVDTVLYFEGERHYHYRLLRSVKNRFGATDEIGVFEMTEAGLSEVGNPSAFFLSGYQKNVAGACVFAGIEGTRPLLMEIQALVSQSYLPSPRRTTVGYDLNRLSMILAVLEARCGLRFSKKDVYLNVVGGLKVSEPSADLAVAAALVSALTHFSLQGQTVFFGEIGLSGEIRGVHHTDLRLKEASKLGFDSACFGKGIKDQKWPEALNVSTFASLQQFIEVMFPVKQKNHHDD